jgi:hypothetical protein
MELSLAQQLFGMPEPCCVPDDLEIAVPQRLRADPRGVQLVVGRRRLLPLRKPQWEGAVLELHPQEIRGALTAVRIGALRE